MLEYGITDADDANLANLGRLDIDDDWFVLVWDAEHSFYLEPLLNREAWSDVTTPESSTLAHEIAVAFRGQFALDDSRLIPQAERVAGGLYTVRGYPESAGSPVTASSSVASSIASTCHGHSQSIRRPSRRRTRS